MQPTELKGKLVPGGLRTPCRRESPGRCGFVAGRGCWRSAAVVGGLVRVSSLAGRVDDAGGAAAR